MTNSATIEKLNSMKLYGMSKAFNAALESGFKKDFTPDEFIAYLVDTEWDDRNHRKIQKLIKQAKFKIQASVQEINFVVSRNIEKNNILRLVDCNWIIKKQNIILTGSTGSGKSYIACALGHQACVYGYKTMYVNFQKLFALLKLSKADGTYINKINRIDKQDLLIIDDFGVDHLDKENRLSLLEIFEDRYNIKSTIIASQIPVKNWYDIIGDPTIADAICDRIIHNSFKINLKINESMRKLLNQNLDSKED
jgi:DNA replication protein DnaC